RDSRLDRDVAIKILPESFTHDADRIARLEREARILASLNHPHIGAIYGLEQTAVGPALVLELVDGPTLAERLAQGPLPIADALRIAMPIAEALDAAHGRGIIHRDIKPSNIKIAPAVKLLDFGLAKDAERPSDEGSPAAAGFRAAHGLSAPGAVMGTVAYMSPEQARGESADARSDLFAFGAVLYEMVTGRLAFADGTGATIDDNRRAAPSPVPPRMVNPQVPRALERVIARLLDARPDARYQSASALRADLVRVAGGVRGQQR